MEQFFARDPERLAELKIKFHMRAHHARLPSQLLLVQILHDSFARVKVVALGIDEAEDIGVMTLVADVELGRPMTELRPRKLAVLDRFDSWMMLQRAMVAFETLKQRSKLVL